MRTAPPEYAVGQLIAEKYRLERVLGEGGQGFVWRAQNVALDVPVAIKVVRSDTEPGETGGQSKRLLREARAAARLGHPAIVRIFDLGQTAAGDPFVVMELLEGESLADHLVLRGPMRADAAVRTLLPIADALVSAHANGIVHRDLKPDNVFLTRIGDRIQPKLLDFGVAKLRLGLRRSQALTQSGTVVGSPAYLSPEQARAGGDVDERSDIWSFAVMLYECLTGDVPFAAASYEALFRSIAEDSPLSTLELGVSDAALWHVLRRGLEKDPHDRWPTMLEFGRALAAWLNARGVADDISGTFLGSKWLNEGSAPAQVAAAPHAGRRNVRRALAAPLRRALVAGGLLLVLTGSAAWVLMAPEPATVSLSSSGPRAEAATQAARAPLEVQKPVAEVQELVVPVAEVQSPVVVPLPAPSSAVDPGALRAASPAKPVPSSSVRTVARPPARKKLDLLNPY